MNEKSLNFSIYLLSFMTNARADSETRANVVVGFKKQTAVKTRKSVSADETEHEGRKQAGGFRRVEHTSLESYKVTWIRTTDGN